MKKRVLLFGFIALTGMLTFAMLSFQNSENNTGQDRPAGIKAALHYLSMLRNNQNTGVINPSDVIKSRAQYNALNQHKSTSDFSLNWYSMGPTNIGGRTRALIFDNRDADGKTLYAAGVNGDIFKTTNLGQTWDKVNTGSGTANLNVSCMIQAPNGTIYAGTGEGFNVQSYSGLSQMGFTGGFIGQGIFMADGNDNFTVVAGTEPSAAMDTLEWAYINEIAVSGNDFLWAAINTGLKIGSAGSWNYASYTDSTGSHQLMGLAHDVKVASDGMVIAEVDGLCYVSKTGAADGFKCYSNSDDSLLLPSQNVGRIEFAIAPSAPNVVYAVVAKLDGSLLNVYLSENSGETWRIIGPGGSTAFNLLGYYYYDADQVLKYYYHGIYSNTISVFPTDPYKIIAGGVQMWEGRKVQETGYYQWASKSEGYQISIFSSIYTHNNHHVYAFRPNHPNEIMIATDGGLHLCTINGTNFEFQPRNTNYVTSQFYTVGVGPSKTSVLGGCQDNGLLWIRPYNVPNYGTDIWEYGYGVGGDGGYCSLSNFISGKAFYAIEPWPTTTTLRFRRTETMGFDWSLDFLDGSMAGNNYLTPMLLWESYNNPNSRDTVVYVATDTLPANVTFPVYSNNGIPFPVSLPTTYYPEDTIRIQDMVSSRLFVATSDATTYSVWMTNEAEQFALVPQWFKIADKTSVGYEGKPQCMAVSHDCDRLFVGTQSGRLFRISNLALAYNYDRADVRSSNCIVSTDELTIKPGGNTQVITSISVDIADANKVLVTLGNYGNTDYVYYSTNALSDYPTFESVQGNLPQMPVYSSILEMGTDDVAIIGTEEGIFVTDDPASKQWTPKQDVMGRVPVMQIVQQTFTRPDVYYPVIDPGTGQTTYIEYPGVKNYGGIYCATYGRGIFADTTYISVGTEPIVFDGKTSVNEVKVFPNPSNSQVQVKFTLPAPSKVEVRIYNLTGTLMQTTRAGMLAQGSHTIQTDVSALKNGSYIIQVISGTDAKAAKLIISR
jgi:hypothetical protein